MNGCPPGVNCGSATGYAHHGCRNQPCRDASTKRQAEMKAKRIRERMANCPHGTTNGYVNYGCLCDACKAAAAADRKAYRATIRAIKYQQRGTGKPN